MLDDEAIRADVHELEARHIGLYESRSGEPFHVARDFHDGDLHDAFRCWDEHRRGTRGCIMV